MTNLKNELLPHQTAAVEKLIKLKVGALFMEQGTGKTITALEIARIRLEKEKIEHIIWLCPCSVKQNLKAEILKQCPDEMLDKFTICGIETLSTSYKALSYLTKICSQKKVFLVVDESLLIKNPRAYRTEHIRRIGDLCPYRIILNGTPVSRNEADLYSQFYLLDWRILGYKSYWSFAANHLEYDDYGKVRRVLNKDYLTDKIAPYSVQISKEECIKIPNKQEKNIYFDITDEQRKHYYDVKEDFLSLEALYEYDTSVIYRTFNALQQASSGRKIISQANKPIEHISFFRSPLENPRIMCLLDTIDELGSEKTIIWCKFTHEIQDINAVLLERGFKTALFYGDLSQKNRQESLKKFESNAQFLIANKTCAGFGLNLQFCHNAIYYNNDWNWATKVQSEDRLHRIGQENEVKIWNICADCTIDERILRCLGKKENMADSFKRYLSNKNFADWLDGKEIEELNDTDRAERETKTGGNKKICS